jgi:hypothetical protein
LNHDEGDTWRLIWWRTGSTRSRVVRAARSRRCARPTSATATSRRSCRIRDHTTKDLAHEINTKTPEGIAAGASAGAAVGGVLGWLVGIGALAIPGIGPLVAAGPSWPRLPARARPARWRPGRAASSAPAFPR